MGEGDSIRIRFSGGSRAITDYCSTYTDRATEEEQEGQRISICHLQRKPEAQATAGSVDGGILGFEIERGIREAFGELKGWYDIRGREAGGHIGGRGAWPGRRH